MYKEWIQIGQDIDGEPENGWIGWSVSLSSNGKTVAISAPFNDGNGENSGHVRVYKYNINSNEWIQIGQDMDGEFLEDENGTSVSLSSDGKIVAMGARYNNNNNGGYAGHVRVYQLKEPEPECKRKLKELNEQKEKIKELKKRNNSKKKKLKKKINELKEKINELKKKINNKKEELKNINEKIKEVKNSCNDN